MENTLWLFVVGVGPFILLAAIIYALVTRRRLSRDEKRRQRQAVKDAYEHVERERSGASDR